MNEAVLYDTVDYVCTHNNNTKFIGVTTNTKATVLKVSLFWSRVFKFLQTRDQNSLTFKTIALVFEGTKPVVFVRNLNLTAIQILAKWNN